MVAIVTLITCSLVPGQVVDRSSPRTVEPAPSAYPSKKQQWLLAPRLSRAQELVYRGLFTEKAFGSGVRFERSYRFSNRLFVLTTSARNLEVAFLTLYRDKDPIRPRKNILRKEAGLRSVRLEKITLNHRGQIAKPRSGLIVPLEGPPTVEHGTFVPFPLTRIGMDRTWTEKEPGRPVRVWRPVGTEMINGTRCIRIYGIQQSADWDQPRADSTAWRRTDTVWVSPRSGIAYRVERVIEQRLPARTQPTQRSVLRYDLESNLQYPTQLVADRRQEILQILSFRKTATPMLQKPNNYKAQLKALMKKIDSHLKDHPPTPYREAMAQIQKRVEAGLRGEIPAQLPTGVSSAYPSPKTVKATTGQPAPPFVAHNLKTSKLAQLKDWKEKPVLMIFYRPGSRTLYETMYFAWQMKRRYPQMGVLAMAMSNDVKKVRAEARRMRIQFPILNGTGLRISYDVESTPKLMILDAEGTVRGDFTGWGPNTPAEVAEELQRWVDRSKEKTE